MKKVLTIIFALLSGIIVAQSPNAFKYQAVIRDNNGNAIINQPVAMQFSIIKDTVTGMVVYKETHFITTSSIGTVDIEIGKGNPVFGDMTTINWSYGKYVLKVDLDVTASGLMFIEMGASQLLSVPYALYAENSGGASNWAKLGQNIYNTNLGNVGIGIENPTGKLTVKADIAIDDTTALFEVKNSQGQRVFAVFNDGAKVYVNEDSRSRAAVGGFAVSGRSSARMNEWDYLRVTPDSVRIYLKESDNRAAVGGFAVSGRSSARSSLNNYLNVSLDTFEIITPSEPRVVWYPQKEAFLTGRVLIESPDSVGTNSMATGYQSRAMGNYSQALGYEALARGSYSTAIGNNAYAEAHNSFAFGTYSKAKGEGSFSFGSGANATGNGSYAFGSQGFDIITGFPSGNFTEAKGDYSFAFGLGARSDTIGCFAFGNGSIAQGMFSSSLGAMSMSKGTFSTAIGTGTIATGEYSTVMGYYSTANTMGSIAMGTFANAGTDTSGIYAVGIGYEANALGDFSFACGRETKANGPNTTALGYRSKAHGTVSTALGLECETFGQGSFAVGINNISKGEASVALGMGSNAEGDYSFAQGFMSKTANSGSIAMGFYAEAQGEMATAIGQGTLAKSKNCMAIGRYNVDEGDSIYWELTDPLFVVGNGSEYWRSNALTLTKEGNMTIAGTLTQSSDKRLKKDIVPFKNALSKIANIQPVYFTFNQTEIYGKDRHIGFIAQEIEKEFPELVRKNEHGYLTVDYATMSSVLLQAINEQQQLIENQQKQLKEQKERIQQLENTVKEILKSK